MQQVDFENVVKDAWQAYDASRDIQSIKDISARVSTNHVYRIKCKDGSNIIAKLSYFGKYEHFVEDHAIINTLSNNLPSPFHNCLARSLFKGDRLFVYKTQVQSIPMWVVFYRPIAVKSKLPNRLDDKHIQNLGIEFGKFHKACSVVRNTLPPSSKTMRTDIEELLTYLNTEEGWFEYGTMSELIKSHCKQFLDFYERCNHQAIPVIPVFVDWNIGNFSITGRTRLYSRWDYDWFRMSTRMIDFYFFARVVSDVGDRTTFTYNISVLQEERFLYFLKFYHLTYPLSREEIEFLPEMYRFFLLNYVIKYGRYFFHSIYADQLKREALIHHLPSISNFRVESILESLKL